MTDKIKEIRDRVEQDVAKGPANKEVYLVHKDRAFLLSEVDRLRAMLPPTAHSGVRNGPGEGSWSVFSEKVVEERDAARAEIERLRADRRERIATAAMQGMLASAELVAPPVHAGFIAKWAVVYADALIAKLDEEGKP